MLKSRTLTINFLDSQLQSIAPSSIVAESMVIEKSLFDDDFKLGGCIATMFECDLINISKSYIQNKRIQVVLISTFYTDETLYPSKNIHPSINIYPGDKMERTEERVLFTGVVDNTNRQSNKKILHITAYDDLYFLSKKNIYTWFSQYAQYSPNTTLSAVANTLIESQLNNIDVVKLIGNWNNSLKSNLNYILTKEKYSPVLYATDLLRSINELSLGFIYIDELGRLNSLQGLKKVNQKTINTYETLEYEDYTTSLIDIFRLTYQDNEIIQWGRVSKTHSCYEADENVIAICSTNKEALSNAIGELLNENKGRLAYSSYQYRPFECVTDDINYSLGDYVKIPTMQDSELYYIDSFITRIRLEGIQNIKTILSATGAEIIGNYDADYEEVTT